jgi:hypothetical protein
MRPGEGLVVADFVAEVAGGAVLSFGPGSQSSIEPMG